MPFDLDSNTHLDPRVREFLRDLPEVGVGDVADRAALLAEAASPEGRARLAAESAFMDGLDSEVVAPSAGLSITTREVVSSPDGNVIRLQVIRPDGQDVLAGVYYIHGGGMAYLSCYLGNYRAWGRMIAARGVVVVMVDYRNAVAPSSVPESRRLPRWAQRLPVGSANPPA